MVVKMVVKIAASASAKAGSAPRRPVAERDDVSGCHVATCTVGGLAVLEPTNDPPVIRLKPWLVTDESDPAPLWTSRVPRAPGEARSLSWTLNRRRCTR